MREDLIDAYGAIDWAVSYLPALEREFTVWWNAPPYLLVVELHPELGKQWFKLEVNRPLPPRVNAGVGAVINSIRSSLDLLATALGARNQKSPSSDRYFHIYTSHQDFIDPLNAAERKKAFTEIDRKKIESLKPYEGGNDFLCALHRLDITRKHHRLVRVDLRPTASIPPEEYWAKGFNFAPSWKRFEDGAIIGWANINATDCEPHLTGEIAFDERGLLRDKPILPTLRQFAGLANSVVQMFE